MCRVTTPSPPLKWLLAYRVLGLRLPPEYAPWVIRDAGSKRFLWWRSGRTFLWLQVLLALALVGRRIGYGDWIPRVWLIRTELLALAVVLFSSRDALIRRTLRWHRIDKRGDPVEKVKPLARLENREATILGLLVLVAFTGASFAYGYLERPTGAAALPCREADPNVLERIVAGKTDAKARYESTRMVVLDDITVVLAFTNLTGQPLPTAKPSPKPSPSVSSAPQVTIEGWIIDAAGVIKRMGDTPDSTTNFPVAPDKEVKDRGLSPLIQRAADCLIRKPVR